MNNDYLNKVLVFLQQELPQFKADMRLSGSVICFDLPEGRTFQPYYEAIHSGVTASIGCIRQRKDDLDFSVKSRNQERDFKVLLQER